MESDQEIRLRLVEAAARLAAPHPGGYGVGVLEMAKAWERYVAARADQAEGARKVLGLPSKKTV